MKRPDNRLRDEFHPYFSRCVGNSDFRPDGTAMSQHIDLQEPAFLNDLNFDWKRCHQDPLTFALTPIAVLLSIAKASKEFTDKLPKTALILSAASGLYCAVGVNEVIECGKRVIQNINQRLI